MQGLISGNHFSLESFNTAESHDDDNAATIFGVLDSFHGGWMEYLVRSSCPIRNISPSQLHKWKRLVSPRRLDFQAICRFALDL